MKISIIIPVYNVEAYIERCLLSVLNQTYPDVEILIVDDCGGDNSIPIAKQILATHPNGDKTQLLFHEKNRGISVARNTGIKAATGDYIFFLDSDDFITTDCIENLIVPLQTEDLDLVVGNYKVINAPQGFSSPLKLKLHAGIIKCKEEVMRTYFLSEWYMMPWNKLINRDYLLRNALYFEEGLIHEDHLWSFFVACTASSIGIVKEATYFYDIHATSLTQAEIPDRSSHLMRVLQLMTMYIRQQEITHSAIHRFMEEVKLKFLRKLIPTNTSLSKQKELYNTAIRNTDYTKHCNWLSPALFPIRQIIINIHYYMPKRLGFLYYKRLILTYNYCIKIFIQLKTKTLEFY
ncbi:Chondroitin polymerase [Bacteroidales bacterium Barb7]|nr:Chondroitin polymerase [Bacteroidales bacterium Barb7]